MKEVCMRQYTKQKKIPLHVDTSICVCKGPTSTFVLQSKRPQVPVLLNDVTSIKVPLQSIMLNETMIVAVECPF